MIGKQVIIRNTHSFAFGGKLGEVKDIREEDPLPYKIAIGNDPTLYGFCKDEFFIKDDK